MGIISNDSIKIEGIDEKFELRDLYIEVVPNEHGKAILSIRVKDDGQPKNIIKSIKDKVVTIKSTEDGNSGTLFKGFVARCTINTVKSSGVVNIELISTSVKLDEEYDSESYQKKGESIKNIINAVANKAKGVNSFCDSKLASESLEKPIIQYKETSWEFIKRIASRYRLPVVVDETGDKPTFSIGYNKKGSASEKDFDKAKTIEFIKMIDYCTRRANEEGSTVTSNDYTGILLRSYKNFNIGSSVSYGGTGYTICSKKVKTEGAQLVFIYEAGSEKLYSLEPIYNEKLHGRCLEGKVVKTRDEYIKLQLDIDKEKKSEGDLYEFKWKPDIGNLMYTMPEKDTVVSLYIGGIDEGDAIVINALRKKDGKDIENPDNKYYTTAKGKRMYLKEDETGLSNDSKDEGKVYAKINDKDGITFSSAKKIYLEAAKEVKIKSGNKLTVSGNSLLQILKGKEGLKVKNKIDVIGKRIAFDFGAAIPEQMEEAKKVTIKNTGKSPSGKELTPEQTKINEMFRGDQFRAENSFNASVPERLRSDLVALNKNCTCIFEENMDGELKDNEKYKARFNDEEVKLMKKLKATRDSVGAVTEDTIMQKVIDSNTYKMYINGEKEKVTGCVAKAEDSAPFSANGKMVHENLRLDYKGSEFKEISEEGKDVYMLRFTSGYCPNNRTYPYVNKQQFWNNPPCTGQGFTGSEENLIPEYDYGQENGIMTAGAIFKIDKEGNECMVAYYNKKRGKIIEIK